MGKAGRKKRESRRNRTQPRKVPSKNGRWQERAPTYGLSLPGQGSIEDSPLFGGEIAYYDENAHHALMLRGWTDFRKYREGDMWEWSPSGLRDDSEYQNDSGRTTIYVIKNGFEVHEPWVKPGLPEHRSYETLDSLLDDIEEIESWRASDPGNGDLEGHGPL